MHITVMLVGCCYFAICHIMATCMLLISANNNSSDSESESHTAEVSLVLESATSAADGQLPR